jgi:predicted nuclease of predicted toxin-antitoxin system
VRFLLDEGIPFRLAALLQETGHDIKICGRDYTYALEDREILAIT